jgi:hypothetical protein
MNTKPESVQTADSGKTVERPGYPAAASGALQGLSRLPVHKTISQGIVVNTTRSDTRVFVDNKYAGSGTRLTIPLQEGACTIIGRRRGCFDDNEKAMVKKDQVDTISLGAKPVRVIWAPGFSIAGYDGLSSPSFKLDIAIMTRHTYTGMYLMVPPCTFGFTSSFVPWCTSWGSFEVGPACQWGFYFTGETDNQSGDEVQRDFFGVGPRIGARVGGDHLRLNLNGAFFPGAVTMFFMEAGLAVEF